MSTNCSDVILATSLAGTGIEFLERMKGRLMGFVDNGSVEVRIGRVGVGGGGAVTSSAEMITTWLRGQTKGLQGKNKTERQQYVSQHRPTNKVHMPGGRICKWQP